MQTSASTTQGPIGHHATLEAFIDTFPMRLPTLLMVEDDPERCDVGWWIDLFKKTRVSGVTLNAGGYVALYPTDVPYHYRSKFLGNRDLFGELLSECKKIGIEYILARTDSHAAHQDVYNDHRDWLYADADGQQQRHPKYSEAWLTCPLGPFNFEFMRDVHREIFTLYDVDFLFCNRWAHNRLCYCEHCRRNFRQAAGLELPTVEDMLDPIYRAYFKWREDRQFELVEVWNRAIREPRPGARFIPNSGGGSFCDKDMLRLATMVPFLIADRQSRDPLMPPWENGKNAKEFRATMGRKPILAGMNVGIGGKYRWMDATKEPAEYRVWFYEAVANGMVPRYTKHSCPVYNKRWVSEAIKLFDWHARHEAYLRNEKPLAQIGIIYSQTNGRYYGQRVGTDKVEGAINGWYQALVEARMPFEFVHADLLDYERISCFKTVVLPNVAAMSDKQCEQIREFVRRGGSLIATYETSLYDAEGNRRENLGLADLFGVEVTGELEKNLVNTYLNVEPDATTGTFHPMAYGLEEAGRILGAGSRLPVEATTEFSHRPITFVPYYPDLPMEEIYPRLPRTDKPEVYLREVGAGRVVYIPWDVDRIFWELLQTDHLRILQNAAAWATDTPTLIEVSGPGMLDVTVWQQKTSLTVHLVNLTNPMTMRGVFRQFFPVGPLTIRLRLPDDLAPKTARLLWTGQEVPLHKDGDAFICNINRLEEYEVVALEL